MGARRLWLTVVALLCGLFACLRRDVVPLSPVTQFGELGRSGAVEQSDGCWLRSGNGRCVCGGVLQ